MNPKLQLKIMFFPFVTVCEIEKLGTPRLTQLLLVYNKELYSPLCWKTNNCSWSSCTTNNWVVVQRIT